MSSKIAYFGRRVKITFFFFFVFFKSTDSQAHTDRLIYEGVTLFRTVICYVSCRGYYERELGVSKDKYVHVSHARIKLLVVYKRNDMLSVRRLLLSINLSIYLSIYLST
jgi:hypothetical protein